MKRRKFTREFKLEAVRLIKDRGVSYGQASQVLGVHVSQLRDWVKNSPTIRNMSSPATARCMVAVYRSFLRGLIPKSNTTDREVSPSAWGEHWPKCLSGSFHCRRRLVLRARGFTQCGSLIEIGAAVQAGAQVFVVSDYTWTIAHHPQCHVFKTLEEAVVAVKARMHGEEARERAIADLRRTTMTTLLEPIQ